MDSEHRGTSRDPAVARARLQRRRTPASGRNTLLALQLLEARAPANPTAEQPRVAQPSIRTDTNVSVGRTVARPTTTPGCKGCRLNTAEWHERRCPRYSQH